MKRRSFLKSVGALVAAPMAMMARGFSPHPSGAPALSLTTSTDFYPIRMRSAKAVEIKWDTEYVYFDGGKWAPCDCTHGTPDLRSRR